MLYRCVGLLEYLRCFNMSVDSKTPGRLGPYLAVAGRGALGHGIVVFFVFSVAPVGAGDCLAVCVAVVSCLKLLKHLRESFKHLDRRYTRFRTLPFSTRVD